MGYPKVISIIDCFVHDRNVEQNLLKSVKTFKSQGCDVLLVSNTKISQEILEEVNYFFYDSRNQLFCHEYPGVSDVDFWTDNGGFVVHNIKSGLQKHGLSVLINLFNSLELAKSLGYTHFQRFETDDLYGPDSLDWIRKVPDLVNNGSKKGLFYINPDNSPADASFHYFYCEIDYFLEKFKRIKSEMDYEYYLMEIQGNRNFRIVEVFIYDHLLKCSNEDLLILKDGKTQMKVDFPDTVWNTVSSASNLPTKYGGCLTGVYRVYKGGIDQDALFLYSYNYVDEGKNRRIRVRCSDGQDFYITHDLNCSGNWAYHPIPNNVTSIEVEEGDKILFKENITEIRSHIDFKV